MQLKCNYCDPTLTKKEKEELKEQGIKPKPIKSINTDNDEYVKDEKGKYYHADCYVQHLMKRKKMSESDAQNKLKEQLELIQLELKELQEKDKFYQWILEYYDCPIPAYFCIKVAEVISGKHERVNEPIPYTTLLDIYQKMAVYLNKNATKNNKQFKSGQRMNYDLAVVLGNYGDYKKHLEKQKQDSLTKIDIEEKLKDSQKFTHKLEEHQKKEKDEFDILDVMDELLL